MMAKVQTMNGALGQREDEKMPEVVQPKDFSDSYDSEEDFKEISIYIHSDLQRFLKANEVCARLENLFYPELIYNICLDEEGIFFRINQKNECCPEYFGLVEELYDEIRQHQIKFKYVDYISEKIPQRQQQW